jgi:hypothetical protein
MVWHTSDMFRYAGRNQHYPDRYKYAEHISKEWLHHRTGVFVCVCVCVCVGRKNFFFQTSPNFLFMLQPNQDEVEELIEEEEVVSAELADENENYYVISRTLPAAASLNSLPFILTVQHPSHITFFFWVCSLEL